ncbi:glutathione S-transferase 1-1-like isoform X4 [Bombyx mandarina]|uniref:Glutathione S-transferase 1-1-like isoform X4 n=1 Tax=Bombyx mandarina TaxID=7092 RepID=A0A6J2KTB5_BOMMA|nr:glutathione S-transferase 1-1-like isoform X4 [Bombyx mandarina]
MPDTHRTCEVCGIKERHLNEKRFFARFPLDVNRCKEWVKIVGKEDLAYLQVHMLHDLKHVCEVHFSRREITKSKKRLKKRAVPKLNLTLPPLRDEILFQFLQLNSQADVTPQGQFEVQAVPSASMPASSSQPSSLEKTDVTPQGQFEVQAVPSASMPTSSVNPVEMAIDLYFTAGSAPCRVVLLVAAALDLQLNLKPLNLWEGEQLQADFLKLNPQHTVPTIVDEGFPLWESRAISRYLVNKYGGDSSSLYPKDLMARALVDQRLDFDIGTLYPRFAQYFYPQVFGGGKPDAASLKKLEEALVFLNAFLEGQKYVTGDVLTIADLSLVATISTIDAAEISLKSYPNVEKWFELMKTTAPDYQNANQKGIDEFKKLIAQMKAKTEL